jgi:uroporphyrinogen decarboxylase
VFSDILTPLPALGYEVEYGGGIRIDPFTFDDVDDWTAFSARKHAPWAADALKAIGEERQDIARLGFAGCPWTTSLYLLAGGTGDKEFHNTRAAVFSNPEASERVLMRMADAVGHLLADQVNHGGADAVQLFDTWAGLLSVEDYQRIALPATKRAIEVFREQANQRVPLIHYAKGSGHLHHVIRTLDIDAMSLDWRDDLRANRTAFGDRFAFQGNLDPSRMHGSPEAATLAAQRVLDEAGDAPGHVFNLGHGFAPGAQIDCVEAVLRLITGESA